MSTWMRVGTAILLLSLTGCVAGEPDHTIDRVFDPCAPLTLDVGDLGPEETESVRTAVDLWNTTIGARLVVGSDPASGTPVVPIRFERTAPFFFGVYDDEQGEILINSDLDGAGPRAITVAHELGHVFGLAHVDEDLRRSVMNPANLETPPTPADADAIAAIWGTCRP